MSRGVPNSPAKMRQHGHVIDQIYEILAFVQLLFWTKGSKRGNGGNCPWGGKSRSVMKSQDHTHLVFLSPFHTVDCIMISTARFS